MSFLYGDISYKLRGCCFHIYNTLGCGHKEIVYQKALAETFKKQGITYKREHEVPIIFENVQVGTYKPDFLIQDCIVLELKSLPFTPKQAESQLLYYLKATPYQIGFLVNFGTSPIHIIRKISTKNIVSAKSDKSV